MSFIELPGPGWSEEESGLGHCWFCTGPAGTTCTVPMLRPFSPSAGERDVEIPSCTACRHRFEAQQAGFGRRTGCGCLVGLAFVLVAMGLTVGGVVLIATGGTALGAGLLAGAVVTAWLVFGPVWVALARLNGKSGDLLARAFQHPDVIELSKTGWRAKPGTPGTPGAR
jgi:hypothetical protein